MKIDRRETKTVHIEAELDPVQVRNALFDAVVARVSSSLGGVTPSGTVTLKTDVCPMTKSVEVGAFIRMTAHNVVVAEDQPSLSTGTRSSLDLAKAAAARLGEIRSEWTLAKPITSRSLQHLQEMLEAVVRELERVS